MNNTDMNTASLGDILDKPKEKAPIISTAGRFSDSPELATLEEGITELLSATPNPNHKGVPLQKVPVKPPSDNIYDDIMSELLTTVSKKHTETRERLEKIIKDAKNIRELLHKQEELAHEAIRETFINLGYVHSYADLLDTDLKKLNEDLVKHAPKKPSETSS